MIERAFRVDYIRQLLKGQQIAFGIRAARFALVFVIVPGHALRADARIAVKINFMLRRQQCFDGIHIAAEEQVADLVLLSCIQVKGQAVVPNRGARAFTADAVGPYNEHGSLDRCSIAALQGFIFR